MPPRAAGSAPLTPEATMEVLEPVIAGCSPPHGVARVPPDPAPVWRPGPGGGYGSVSGRSG
ncbi:hypothetical protein [Nonomuraea antimicrobica]